MAALFATPLASVLAGISTDNDNGGNGSGSTVCSTAKQVICGGTSPPKDLCDAITTCCSTDTLPSDRQLLPTQCIKALVKVDRNDIEAITTTVATLAPDAVEAFCSATKSNVDLVNQSTDLAENTNALYRWYMNDVNPAIVDTCAKTKYPISETSLNAASQRMQTALCGPTDILNYPKQDLVVLKYLRPIAGIVIGVIALLLVLSTVLGVSLRNARRQMNQAQQACTVALAASTAARV